MSQLLSFEEWKELLVEQYVKKTAFDEQEARDYVEMCAMDWIEGDYNEGLTPEECCENDIENWEPENA